MATSRSIVVLLKQTGQEVLEDNCMSLSAAIAYSTLFSLPPLLVIVVAIAGAVFGADTVQQQITDQVGGLVGVEGARSYRSDGSAWSDQGTLTADFDGLHGWYWQNAGDQPVTVTLRTDGDYLDLVRYG